MRDFRVELLRSNVTVRTVSCTVRRRSTLMRGTARGWTAAFAAAVTGLVMGVSVPAAGAYQTYDYCLGQCNDILPPGENGNASLAYILANKALGTRPAHTDDQLSA